MMGQGQPREEHTKKSHNTHDHDVRCPAWWCLLWKAVAVLLCATVYDVQPSNVLGLDD